ncbi:ChbG/HpnK family deacetylase [Agrobacterium sp.]|uniref:ChbG/HpnK family deacetylase n=1 Tax=Agrobacterium sp. TaxID=361 RepID=UPI0028A87FCB|nr:ChbG/HpnK family deacetylase [Agrobacterium sp.]
MSMAAGHVFLVADDYGLSPAVSNGIRHLISNGKLSGTGCMTLFPEWSGEAAKLRACQGYSNIFTGIHLTLTDFKPLTDGVAICRDGRLLPLKELILAALRPSQELTAQIHAELDAQLAAFTKEMGHLPHYLDGHQHVHFLPPVRSWLKNRFQTLAQDGGAPWVRGAPAVDFSQGLKIGLKTCFVAGLACGFDGEMRSTGFQVQGPLRGFYDWQQAEKFGSVLRGRVGDGTVMMCHPGYVDDVLQARDPLTGARAEELRLLEIDLPFALAKRV